MRVPTWGQFVKTPGSTRVKSVTLHDTILQSRVERYDGGVCENLQTGLCVVSRPIECRGGNGATSKLVPRLQ